MYDPYFRKIHEECELRNRSTGTAQAYEANIRLFLKETGKSPEELTLEDTRQFILAKRRSGISASTCNFYNSSLAFFYRHVLHVFWDQEVVPRMRRDCRVPDILSVEDVERMIDTATEVRNKALISLIKKTVGKQEIRNQGVRGETKHFTNCKI